MLRSKDMRLRSLAERSIKTEKLRKLWKVVSGTKGAPPKDPLGALLSIPKQRLTSKYWRKAERRQWAELLTQGMGVEVFKNDKVSNGWLSARPKTVSQTSF